MCAVKNRLKKFRQAFRYLSVKSLAFAIAMVIITAAIAAFVGRRIYTMKNETLLLRGELNTKEATMEYNSYLRTRVDIVTMVANVVADYIETDTDSAMIEAYLTKETDNIIETLDANRSECVALRTLPIALLKKL